MSINWSTIIRPDYIDAAADTIAALESARAEFRPCEHYAHPSGRIEIMAAGGYGGDLLDDSNAAALDALAREWYDDERNDDTADPIWMGVDFHPAGAGMTVVCIDPAHVNAELLAEIIGVAEQYADYPVLDESDYSDREWTAWGVALEWAMRDIPEEHRPAVAEWVTENRYGYAEPGYVADEWVTLAMRDLGLTTRRVRGTGHAYDGYYYITPAYGVRVDLYARDADGYVVPRRLGSIRPGRIAVDL